MPKNFIDRIRTSAPRTRTISWPFASEGDTPKVVIKVLGLSKLEEARFATEDYFKAQKRKVERSSGEWEARETAEIVFRAYSTEDGKALASSTDDLVDVEKNEGALLYEQIKVLATEWAKLQDSSTLRPLNDREMEELVDELKKNSHSAIPSALPLTWLLQLIRTLASRLESSTPASSQS